LNVYLLLVLLAADTQPNIEIERDGGKFTVECSIVLERSASDVWDYLWEFQFISLYVDNCRSIDSLKGGEDWYHVRYSAEFPFLYTEITNRKYIIEQGTTIGTTSVNSVVDSPFPLAFLGAKGYWKLYPLDDNRCKIYFRNQLEVEAAGFEGLYTGIARRDAKRILKNFKHLVESSQ
jgi:hypothetical protein